MITFLKKLFTRRKPTYGAQIFQQKSWLERQVEDEIWKRHVYSINRIRWFLIQKKLDNPPQFATFLPPS